MLFTANFSTSSINLFIPIPLLALVITTGTFKILESLLTSIFISFFNASSYKLRHITTFLVISKVCNTKFKFLSIKVESHTIIVTLLLLKQRKSLATLSSSEWTNKEYVPGKSYISYILLLYLHIPIAVSTVFPVQLPVCCLRPVNALKIVLFPTLGFPIKVILIFPIILIRPQLSWHLLS